MGHKHERITFHLELSPAYVFQSWCRVLAREDQCRCLTCSAALWTDLRPDVVMQSCLLSQCWGNASASIQSKFLIRNPRIWNARYCWLWENCKSIWILYNILQRTAGRHMPSTALLIFKGMDCQWYYNPISWEYWGCGHQPSWVIHVTPKTFEAWTLFGIVCHVGCSTHQQSCQCYYHTGPSAYHTTYNQ